MEPFFILASVALILISLYYYLTWNYNFWQKQGIPCAKGIIPGIGNIAPVLFFRQSFACLCENYYKENANLSMFGFYQLTTPFLLVRDPEVVKSILLTNFPSFQNNHFEISSFKEDDLLSINPFFSKSDTWKDNRAPLSNAFSGKKLKSFFPLVQEVTSKMEGYLKRKINLQNGKLELDFKQFFNLYTNEVAAAGIGIQSHNFQDDTISETNELNFKKVVEMLFAAPIFSGGLSQVILMYIPRLARFLNLSMTPKDVNLFFRETVKSVLVSRQNDNKTHSDFIQVMIDYMKANGSKIDEETALASHILSFSIEIYETSALTLSFLGFQLAAHPEIQEKVREEIKSVLEKCDGKLNYEVLKEMTYLDQVLNESMRMNHVLGTMTKVCTKEIQLVGPDGLSCKMKPGQVAVISTFGLQMDPKYWPDPEKFDPDRFSEEQKKGRHKFAFIPFGEGPRICVGMRLANIIMKVSIAAILTNFSIEVSTKTPLPLKKGYSSFVNCFEHGLWVILKPLNQNGSRK